MEVSKLFEKASSLYDTAHEKCAKSGIDISCITLILSDNDVIFHGVNWKRLKDDFTEEETCSEYEAMLKMILSGETKIKSIITLNSSKETVKPCLKCVEMMLKTNIENKDCNLITGKKSQITLSSSDKEIGTFIDQYEKDHPVVITSEEKTDNNADEKPAEASSDQQNSKAEEVKTAENDTKTESAPGKPESFDMESIGVNGNAVLSSAAEDKLAHSGDNSNFAMEAIDKENAPAPINDIPVKAHTENAPSVQMADINDRTEEAAAETKSDSEPVSHLGIDTSGLKMIFDDWEANDAAENTDTNISNKPFNINSLNPVDNTNAAGQTDTNGPAQQQPSEANQNIGGMYQQQPMNGMYQQQPMNGMYQQQQMNGMYQQQPMNGMYQQQPMNGMYQQQQMNGMYQQQPMNGMYQQQPMNGMYQQQPMNGMYQQQPMNSMYQRQPMNSINAQSSLYMSQIPSAQSVSINNYQTPYSQNMPTSTSSVSRPTTQSMSVYGTGINTSDNNAIFKDRLNNILNSSSKPSPSVSEEQQYEDAIQSAKDRKKAAKIDAKFLKKQKKNGNI